MHVSTFKKRVWAHYRKHGRHDLPWRKKSHLTPYRVLVSELMLQQTQVARVVPKYRVFIKHFPTFSALADARLKDVLQEWQGLGYNSRARHLWETARIVVSEHGGRLPRDRKSLEALPGVGSYTAGALRAFVWNMPEVFVETNIRTVFIHHFFVDQSDVSDAEILALAEKALDAKRPREWYYALMDYGAYLKASGVQANAQSKHYAKQSPFEGSDRQIRAAILRLLLDDGEYTLRSMSKALDEQAERLRPILAKLENEGLIQRSGVMFRIV